MIASCVVVLGWPPRFAIAQDAGPDDDAGAAPEPVLDVGPASAATEVTAPVLLELAAATHAAELVPPGSEVTVVLGLSIDAQGANLGVRVEHTRTPIGEVVLDVNGFARYSDDLIVMLGADKSFIYENLYRARGLGIENAVSWVSPGRHVALDGMLSWQDQRNTSTTGAFETTNGDRIPNRPYLFASWGAALRFDGVLTRRHSVSPFYNGRYVHGFFRGWESQGMRSTKQSVDSQVAHSIGVTWFHTHDIGRITATAELDNVFAAKLFDNFGVERPGRAFYLKLTVDFR